MQIQSTSPRTSSPIVRRNLAPRQNQPGDQFQAGQSGPNDLIPNGFIQSNKGGNGSRTALQMAGIGVMFGGILASVNLPSSWVGVGIIGSMCAGVALMSLANKQ